MSVLKMNLRGGAASLASFMGVGQPQRKPKARVAPRFSGIGAAGPEAEDEELKRARRAQDAEPKSAPDDKQAPPDDDDDDDDALDDDDFGADAPDAEDSSDEAEAKRCRRVARRARRMAREKAGNKPPKKASTASGDDDDDDDDGRNNPDDSDDDDEDDPGQEMRGQSATAQARRRERARCAAIFSHKAAQANPNLAGHLAFNTNLTRCQAIAALAQGGSGRQGVLAGAMSAYAGQRPGAPPAQPTKAQTIQAEQDDAFKTVTAYRRQAR